jgi:hypothetical protein
MERYSMKFFDYFSRWFKRPGKKPAGNGRTSQHELRKMLEQIAHTYEMELSCDEVLVVIARFAEAKIRGEDAAELMPLVQRHLATCGDCREEFEALLRILRASAD